MGKITGFIDYSRELAPRRPVAQRVNDWFEIYQDFPEESLRKQGARCMDCGVPFCQTGCPVSNHIPDWNDLVYRGRWKDAVRQLHATNNFPEFTGRICPAPCEASCVLGLTAPPVAIKQNEKNIVERAFLEGWIHPEPPKRRTGKTVAIVGSGPRNNSAEPVILSRSTKRMIASAVFSATAFRNSSWRSTSSTAVSSRCPPRA